MNRLIQTLKTLFFVVSIFIFTSCVDDYGKHVQADNVTIYYKEPVTKKQASTLLNFWLENQFNGAKPQYMQLRKKDRTIILNLIPSDTNLMWDIPFDVQLVMRDLQSRIDSVVFPDSCFEIRISDNQFNRSVSPFE